MTINKADNCEFMLDNADGYSLAVRYPTKTNYRGFVGAIGEYGDVYESASATIDPDDIEDRIRWIRSIDLGAFSLDYRYPANLEMENAQLRQEIEGIKDILSNIMDRLPQEKVVVLREISKDQAKNEVKQLFSSGRTLYYSDIAQELGIDLELVVSLCKELEEEGEIGVDASIH